MARPATTGNFRTQRGLIAALKTLRKTGARVSDICAECGISVPTYYRLMPARAQKGRAVGNRGTREALEDRVHLMRANGLSDAAIAKAVGVAPQTVSAIESHEPVVEADASAALIAQIKSQLAGMRKDLRALERLL